MALQNVFPRVTMYFQFNRKSWSESHYMIAGGAQTPQQIQAAWAPLLTLRSKLLGPGILISNVKYGSDGQYRLFITEGSLAPITGNNIEPIYNSKFSETWSADPNVAILVKAQSDSDQYHKHIFLAGLPVGVTGEETSVDPVINDIWQQALNAYLKKLVGAWGFRVRAVGADAPNFNIQSYIFANGSVTASIAPGQAGTLPALNTLIKVGKVVMLSGLSINGIWLVTGAAAGPPQTITFAVPFAQVGNSAKPNTGFLRSNYNGVAPYGGFEPGIVVTRKRGVGYDPPRGKSRRRPASL